MSGRARRGAVLICGALLFFGFCGLGTWQLRRLAWKLDLIARTEARVHAPPAAPPGPGEWAAVTAKSDEYRHVRVSGAFDNARETPVQAVTAARAGYWIMTPLRTDAGYTVLVNRGFVPPSLRAASARRAGLIAGPTSVTGLLRLTEPRGGFLRANQPTVDRWYSRDVAAIANARGLERLAP
jgi:surfeit locus 1 family protein